MSKRPLRAFFLAVSWVFLVPASAQSIALTFDDGFNPTIDVEAARSNAQILESLKANNIRAMFFPAGAYVDSPEGMALVTHWSKAGHAIGNHTYTHQALSTYAAKPELFFDDVMRAQAMFSSLPGWCPRLRYPYFDEGNSPALRNDIVKRLADHGYGVAAATIAIEDWTYNANFVAARQKDSSISAGMYRERYLERIWQEASLQDTTWTRNIGRSPPHVLLLHANTLNAMLLSEIIAMFRSKGWRFIEPNVAFSDPIYSRAWMQDDRATGLSNPVCR